MSNISVQTGTKNVRLIAEETSERPTTVCRRELRLRAN